MHIVLSPLCQVKKSVKTSLETLGEPNRQLDKTVHNLCVLQNFEGCKPLTPDTEGVYLNIGLVSAAAVVFVF